ncbi:hypothetical protein ABZ511_22260 [Nocardia gamkensis]|uniref:hypothetical protein n=1 Tax=Nocardia gamkensis TaxID=352869 RepID=UPI0033E7B8F2
MNTRATELGVAIETGSRVDRLPTGGPVIVATDLHSARELLDDRYLAWTSGHAVLLDIAVPSAGTDRSPVFGFGEGGFPES